NARPRPVRRVLPRPPRRDGGQCRSAADRLRPPSWSVGDGRGRQRLYPCPGRAAAPVRGVRRPVGPPTGRGARIPLLLPRVPGLLSVADDRAARRRPCPPGGGGGCDDGRDPGDALRI